MHKIADDLKTKTGWELIKTAYHASDAIGDGTRFLIGNGYLGYRGTFAENTKEDYVACVVTDTWDNADGKWEELVTVPNALWTTLSVDGTPFSVKTHHGAFEKTLDLKGALNHSSVSHTFNHGATVSVKESKFASYALKHVVAMRYEVATDQAVDIAITTGIDSDVWSMNGNHFAKSDYFIHEGDYGVNITTTTAKDTIIVLEKTVWPEDAKVDTKAPKRKAHLHITPDKPCVFEKFMIVVTSNDVTHPLDVAKDLYRKIYGFEALKKAHSAAWDALWTMHDIEIEGNLADQLGVRFNLYHALIATPVHKALPIGARGLSCQAYQGAAWWDGEIYNMPMYLFTNPLIAKNLLIFRHKTLDGARAKAKRLGYEGAFYPWVSGKRGEELCPDFFFKDVLTGRDIRNHFNVWQIHVSMDIAYAVMQYYHATQDHAFMEDYGIEMLLEIARFTASRVVWIPHRNRYEIHQVLGPDVYHENIDNNAFTNWMARYALKVAIDALETFSSETIKRVKKTIQLRDDEITLWHDIIDKLMIPSPNKAGVIEQFDHYFDLETVLPASKLKERLIDEGEYYGWPNGIAVYTQCIKQADVIQLMVLFRNQFTEATHQANIDYYEPRTLHFSSLSPSTNAIGAARANRMALSETLFRHSLNIDLLNTKKSVTGGTFIGGSHTAANGATWQMVMFGFLGLTMEGDGLVFHPRLPQSWTRVKTTMYFRDQTIIVTADKATLYLKRRAMSMAPISVSVLNRNYTLHDTLKISIEKS